ncbi:MAG: AAA family ATPase, partial [Planctomycetes bacterium]|nr:AAA family ATPase [Planctomycetota bacterium]
MKVRDIQIDGFGVWSGLSVDSLPEGMTVFYGPNEAGKTTLMQFLRTMLYGFTAERRQRYLPPVFGGKPGGAMRVTGPGGGYEIARRATLNDPSIIGQLTVTSSDGVTQGQHRLTTLLGSVDESIFTNVFAIGLRELQELSTLDDTAAADELYKLSSGLDRVSLVDVIRQLKGARAQIVSQDSEAGQLTTMLQRREKLRDEIEQLTVRARRWGELATHKRNQQNEIEELRQRIEQWELEAKTVETSLQVREPWLARESTKNKIKTLHARIDVPDNAVSKLKEIHEQVDDKRRQIQSIKEERRSLRQRASDMPVSKGILALSGKIEAANEQGPWITSLQLQIQRLESECQQTQEQLLEDAKRLGLSDHDQEALLNDKRLANLPDLSRQAIGQLAGPARDVRVHQTRLKQAK